MKQIFYISLVVLFYSSAFGQIFSSYGFKIGLTNSNQVYEYSFLANDEEFDYRQGISLGIFAELLNSSNFSLILNLAYNQKGMLDEFSVNKRADSDLGYTSEKFNVDNRLDYVTIGTDVKTRYDLNGFSPFILTGIKYDFLVGKKIDRSIDKLFERSIENIYDKYEGNLFGLTLGLGIEINEFLSIPFIVEWVYNYDLDGVRVNDNLKIKNLSSVLNIGIKLN